MSPHRAEALAKRLAQSFPRSTIAPDIWIEQLLDMDAARAEEAVRQMVRNLQHAPTIAHLWDAYHNTSGTAREQYQCLECAGSGWVTDRDHPNHWPGRKNATPMAIDHKRNAEDPNDCVCNVVRPCSCDAGRRHNLSKFNTNDLLADDHLYERPTA